MGVDRGRAVGPTNDVSGTAGAASSQIAAADPWRKYMVIQNIDATNAIWINFGAPATKGAGSFKLLASGSMTADSGFMITDTINVIADAGTPAYTAKLSSG